MTDSSSYAKQCLMFGRIADATAPRRSQETHNPIIYACEIMRGQLLGPKANPVGQCQGSQQFVSPERRLGRPAWNG